MAGTHYTLDRDKLANLPKEKLCSRCRVTKPNDFKHFGKKISGKRHLFTTTDVCHVCRVSKHRETLKRKADEEAAYQKYKADQQRAAEDRALQRAKQLHEIGGSGESS